jgi:hypothetical protein
MEIDLNQMNKKETAYATLLRDVKPLGGAGYQTEQWRKLRDMIRDDHVRHSRWDRFNDVAERGQ